MARPLQAYKQIHNAKESYFLQEVKPVSIPAPVGGWDGISPLANMKPEFAVTLENIVPRPGWVELRGGRNTWAQTLGSTGTKPVAISELCWLCPCNCSSILSCISCTIIR